MTHAADQDRIETILDYWFGPLPDDETFPAEHAKRWFQGRPAVDRDIHTRFGEDVRRASRGEYDHWETTPRGRLALIILLDQFSRNIYRGSPEAFAQDPHALRLALTALEQGLERRVRPVEAMFLCMLLMHAESREVQATSVERFTALAERATPAMEFPLRHALDYAKRHQEIIARFGRFPHRNVILNRPSSPEELEFLKQPNSSF